ncbi:hypothetical protein [uncultured Phocaeicola sp.]|uniref:hypothetical protein n=1 Tax=uncultured Phocaeicola sp. TaxID=990718 RepID=UPI00261740AA|nr:hypothetical protein [uncultured Phocaeicola sp.]
MQNRPSVPGDDGFMEDLVRQIDLLPVPASLNGKDDAACQEKILKIMDMSAKKKESDRRHAIAVASVSVICAVLSLALISLLPEVKVQAPEYESIFVVLRYMVAGAVGLLTLSLRHPN